MAANRLLDTSRVEIKLGDYGVAPATALVDASWHPRVQDYRRLTGSRMMPLGRDDVRQKVPTAEYHVSRKVDGEFTVFIYRDGDGCTLNPGGTVRVGLPWMDEAAKLLSRAGIQEALVVGELYALRPDGQRTRVHDVAAASRQPQSADDLQRLRFAVFDLLSIGGQDPPPAFAATWALIEKIFGGGDTIHPVETKQVKDADAIDKLFQAWVEEQGAEGLVVRSDTAGMYKVKPRHTLDAAVIGFTESADERQGMLHDLLLAVARQDGSLQVLSRVGGGFSDDERREMLSDLKDLVVASEYAEVNSDHVAYQMVRPEWVVEISCLDLISQTTRGGPVNRMVLGFHDQNGSSSYQVIRRLPLAAVISPQFIRRRDDKSVTPFDVRIQQVTELVEVPLADRDARELTLPRSEILRREVYTKQLKGETMVRKFLMWKTNKEAASDEYPAYVLHFTDFSPNRKEPLARDVRISSSLDQMEKLWEELKASNIKAGWGPYAAADAAAAPAEVAEPVEAEKPKQAPSERTTKKPRAPRKKKSG